MMASTRVLSNVQEVESLRFRISGVKGSVDECPHNVPEQPVAGLSPLVAPPDPVVVVAAGVVTTGPGVVTTGPAVVATAPEVAPPRLHSTFAAQSQLLIA